MLAKRLLVSLLSGLLIAIPVVQPVAVYAETVSGSAGLATVEDAAAAVVDESDSEEVAQPETDNAASVDQGVTDSASNQSDLTDSSSNAASASASSLEKGSPSEDAIESAMVQGRSDNAAESASNEEDAAEVSPTAVPVSTVEFVYIDQSIVSIGENQYIAIGLTGIDGPVSSATLELVNTKQEQSAVDAGNIVDGSMLFTIAYTDDSQANAYTITRLTYALDDSGETFVVDFSDDSNEANDYTYEVATADLVDTLDASGTEDGVTAMTIDDEGGLHAADSVEAAIESADAAGVTESAENATAPSVAASRARSAVTSTRENYLVVAIDPGHGGSDGGSSGNGLQEKNVNWSIANALKNELDTYTGVTAYLTRSENECPSLPERADRAATVGADVFVSVHCNAGADVRGAEVWAPNSSSYNSSAHQVGTELGNKVLAQLEKLGLHNRGVKFRDYGDGENGSNLYPDGSMADYYGVIRNSRKHGIPAIIVEHAFISNAADASILASKQTQLGQADATAVAQQYNLGKNSTAKSQASVAVTSHVSNIGWEDTVYDHKVSGTTGKNFNLEAFKVNLLNSSASSGGIQYRANVGGSWQGWVSNGGQAGTTGQNKAVQAVQLQLTGGAASKYDVYYRVHVANIGWLGWAKNGASAGTSGYGYGVQAIEIVLVNKGGAAPGSTSDVFRDKKNEPTSVTYRAHVRNIGWQGWTSGTAGTTGKALPIEALQINVQNAKISGGLSVQAHVMNIGWMDAVGAGKTAGTTGRALQVEAVRIKLTGELANQYDIYYRTHVANIGWLGWAKNGASAGSQGYAYGVEAIEIKLVAKNGKAPGSTNDVFRTKYITYQAHVSNIGWQSTVNDGATGGTTGRNLPMEALKVSLGSGVGSGGVQVRAHVSNVGWQGWTTGIAGTTGRALPIEAVQIKLTGDAAKKYEIYYRVHSADYGWLGWAKNGESAGTQGYAKSAQAIQIKLVAKGGKAPGSTTGAFKNNIDQPIMGAPQVTKAQMVKQYKKYATYPSGTYAAKGADSIDKFVDIVISEANAEGVRPDVVFAQAMHETNWLRFGGDVKAEQCNFAGIGATGNGAAGATFKDVRTGIRAQVQHLKAYASTMSLKNAVVDPRFSYVKRGSATTILALGGKWATGSSYGEAIINYINAAKKL